MPLFLLLFFMFTTFLSFGQVDKVFQSDVFGFGGERLELKKSGIYKFSEWGCLESTSGNGTYKIKGDTVIITSYEAEKFPFEIVQSYDRKHNDILNVTLENNVRGIITSIVINDSIKVFELSQNDPFNQNVISVPKPFIAKMTINYLLPNNKSQISKDIYIGSNNVVNVIMNYLEGYFRPLTLPDKWHVKGDTIYDYSLGNYLVDSSLSIQFSDMFND